MAVTILTRKFLKHIFFTYSIFIILLCFNNETWGGKGKENDNTNKELELSNYQSETPLPLNILMMGLYSNFSYDHLLLEHSYRASFYGFHPNSSNPEETKISCFSCCSELNLANPIDLEKLKMLSENCHNTLADGQPCMYSTNVESTMDRPTLSTLEVQKWYQIYRKHNQFENSNFDIENVNLIEKIRFTNIDYLASIERMRLTFRCTDDTSSTSTLAGATGITNSYGASRNLNTNNAAVHQAVNIGSDSNYRPTFGSFSHDDSNLMGLNSNCTNSVSARSQNERYKHLYPEIYQTLKLLEYTDEQISDAIHVKLLTDYQLDDTPNDQTIDILLETLNRSDFNVNFETNSNQSSFNDRKQDTSLNKSNKNRRNYTTPILNDTEKRNCVLVAQRKETYKKECWPQHLNGLINKLVDAGFQYNGQGCSTSCFHCKLTVNNWSEESDPWAEHIKSSPSCNFFLMRTTAQYSDEVREDIERRNKVRQARTFKNTYRKLIDSEICTDTDRIFHAICELTREGYALTDNPSDQFISQILEKITLQILNNQSGQNDENGYATSQILDVQEVAASSILARRSPEQKHIQEPTRQHQQLETTQQLFTTNEGNSKETDEETKIRAQSEQYPSIYKNLKAITDSKFAIFKTINTYKERHSSLSDDISLDPDHYNDLINILVDIITYQQEGSEDNVRQNTPEDTTKNSKAEVTTEPELSSEISAEEKRKIMQENEMLRENENCKVCLTHKANMVFIPCGHYATCNFCSPRLRNCPMCRGFITSVLKVNN